LAKVRTIVLEIGTFPCYICNVMSKTLKQTTGNASPKRTESAFEVVCDSKTGQFITVRGVGALKGSEFKIRKGVSLMKPIAAQALSERPEKRKAG
jgi:hypothetical protein